jgi:hypothetical protein
MTTSPTTTTTTMETETESNFAESPTEEDEVFFCKRCGEVCDDQAP